MMREAEEPHARDLPERGFVIALEYVLDGFAARIARSNPALQASIVKRS
jgi:hypothetical protein